MGIIEVGVASQDIGEYFIVPQVASNIRGLAQLDEATAASLNALFSIQIR